MKRTLRNKCLTSALDLICMLGVTFVHTQIPKRTADGPKASLIVLPLVSKSHLRAVEPYKDQCVDEINAVVSIVKRWMLYSGRPSGGGALL